MTKTEKLSSINIIILIDDRHKQEMLNNDEIQNIIYHSSFDTVLRITSCNRALYEHVFTIFSVSAYETVLPYINRYKFKRIIIEKGICLYDYEAITASLNKNTEINIIDRRSPLSSLALGLGSIYDLNVTHIDATAENYLTLSSWKHLRYIGVLYLPNRYVENIMKTYEFPKIPGDINIKKLDVVNKIIYIDNYDGCNKGILRNPNIIINHIKIDNVIYNKWQPVASKMTIYNKPQCDFVTTIHHLVRILYIHDFQNKDSLCVHHILDELHVYNSHNIEPISTKALYLRGSCEPIANPQYCISMYCTSTLPSNNVIAMYHHLTTLSISKCDMSQVSLFIDNIHLFPHIHNLILLDEISETFVTQIAKSCNAINVTLHGIHWVDNKVTIGSKSYPCSHGIILQISKYFSYIHCIVNAYTYENLPSGLIIDRITICDDCESQIRFNKGIYNAVVTKCYNAYMMNYYFDHENEFRSVIESSILLFPNIQALVITPVCHKLVIPEQIRHITIRIFLRLVQSIMIDICSVIRVKIVMPHKVDKITLGHVVDFINIIPNHVLVIVKIAVSLSFRHRKYYKIKRHVLFTQ